jgi:hypothetical protein
MNQSIIFAVTVLCVCCYARSSAQPGIYRTQADYTDHHILPVEKIGPSGVLNSNKIIIITGGKKTVVKKDELFGYRDAKGKDYRFYQHNDLEIVDTTGFFLYRYTGLCPNAGGKGFSSKTVYYFSKGGGTEPSLLNVKNLEDAFASNTRFRYSLYPYRLLDNELADYDQYARCYKVKYLFEQSLK